MTDQIEIEPQIIEIPGALGAGGLIAKPYALALDNDSPAVGRIDAYGKMASPSRWDYKEHPEKSLIPGGTAAGGWVILPPQVDIYDIAKTFEPDGIDPTTTFFMVGRGARFGAGTPSTVDGTMRNGYSWREVSSELVFATHNGNMSDTDVIKFTSGEDIAWKSGTSFYGTIAHAATAARTWTYPDLTAFVALTSLTVSGGLFTAGSIPFGNTDGSLAQDNSNLFYDNTLNQVNIGTPTSQTNAILNINSDGKFVLLPVKTTTGDMASGQDGAFYYNNIDEDLRAHINGSWRSLLYFGGFSGSAIRTETGDYTVLDTDEHVIGDATSGVLTLTMPSAADVTNQVFTLSKGDTSANKVVVSAADGIGAAASATLDLLGADESVMLQSDGTQYWIKG